MVIYGNQTVRAAVKAVEDVLRQIRAARGAHTVEDQMVSVNRLFALQGEKGVAKS
jgi:2-methylisocitrate lyase-like PEP mutase family enzyme